MICLYVVYTTTVYIQVFGVRFVSLHIQLHCISGDMFCILKVIMFLFQKLIYVYSWWSQICKPAYTTRVYKQVWYVLDFNLICFFLKDYMFLFWKIIYFLTDWSLICNSAYIIQGFCAWHRRQCLCKCRSILPYSFSTLHVTTLTQH